MKLKTASKVTSKFPIHKQIAVGLKPKQTITKGSIIKSKSSKKK